MQYAEPLTTEEWDFLAKKEAKERKVYFKVFRILMIFSFVGPFIGSWYRAYEGAENAFSYSKFFTATAALLTISSIATYLSYRLSLRKVQQDIRHKTKTIATHKITRKVFMPQNGAHYFYIDSVVKLSIEVNDADYERYAENDEINIEYTSHSMQYLGYF